jgi:hypothetical protein
MFDDQMDLEIIQTERKFVGQTANNKVHEGRRFFSLDQDRGPNSRKASIR